MTTSHAPPPSAERTLPGEVLGHTRAVTARLRALEVEQLLLALEWADSHPVVDPHAEPYRARERRALAAGALGDASDLPPSDGPEPSDPFIPEVSWHAAATFAVALGTSTAAGAAMIRDALVLRHRLPLVWSRVERGEVVVWRARRVAQAALGRAPDVVTYLDQQVAPLAHSVGATKLERVIDEAMLRLHPEERELDQLEALDHRHATLHEGSLGHTGIADMTLRGDWADLSDFDETLSLVAAALASRADELGDPGLAHESLDARRSRAVGVLSDPAAALALLEGTPLPAPARRVRLVVHLTPEALRGLDPVGVLERGDRAVLTQLVQGWCLRSDRHVSVLPVLDLTTHRHSPADDAPEWLRQRSGFASTSAVTGLGGGCVFPFCARPARDCDCDHRVARGAGGATCDCNLAPLCRRHHRLKTHAGWRYSRIEPRVWLWSEPHGQSFVRDELGTRDVTPPPDPGSPSPSGCGSETVTAPGSG